jgi:coenzyme F420-reducing hydrogenase alpha subunit
VSLLEGRLRLAVDRDGATVTAVRIDNRRPFLAGPLLRGRPLAEVPALVRRFYTLCGEAQSVAAVSALEAAAGIDAQAEHLREREQSVQREVLREHCWQVLIDWPRAAGIATDPELPLLLHQLRSNLEAGRDDALAALVGQHIFGCDCERWLAGGDVGAWRDWARDGITGTARLLAGVWDEVVDLGRTTTPLLVLPQDETTRDGLTTPLRGDAGFARLPQIDGEPRETGPLARVAGHPALAALHAAASRTALIRMLARLVELATLAVQRPSTVWLRAHNLAPNEGMAFVETARGLLMHWALVSEGQVRDYRVVAPTEWNFHPGGACTQGLLAGCAAVDAATLRRRIGLVIASLDPCVRCEIEIDEPRMMTHA